nr:hypothetical protein [Tanacetum cinerariifolium]
FEVLIHRVGRGAGVHPAAVLVKALVNKELPPGHGPVGIEARLAGHLHLRAEIERGVWIDEQQRVPTDALAGRNGEAIRAHRLALEPLEVRPLPGPRFLLAVEGFQPIDGHHADITPDAALAEQQRHPGLKPAQ